MQTILIVDDTKTNIDILVNLLDDYDVIASLNGKDALKIVKEEDIDLILLDIMMPDMDGFEVCKTLKSKKKTKNIPIIFLTAKTQKEDIEKGFALGAVDYLIKPFYSAELKARVKTHLELRSYQKDLEKKVKQESRKNRLQDQILFQKTKQAEMGELLMQISHQWKQPLMEIGSLNMFNTAKIKLNEKIDKEEFLENFSKISNILTFMSSTMESFQNFYKPNYKAKMFNISNAVAHALSIVDSTLQRHNIEVVVERKDINEVYGNSNEYSNIILIILNNVKDVVKMRGISSPKVYIKIDSLEDRSYVKIEDNCGGICFENIDDVFLPFVTEKKSAGVGLYMAKTICEKYGGSIKVENSGSGAIFTIAF